MDLVVLCGLIYAAMIVALAVGIYFDFPITEDHKRLGCRRSTVTRAQNLDRPKAEFSGLAQSDGLVTPLNFVSTNGTLLPIAQSGRSSS